MTDPVRRTWRCSDDEFREAVATHRSWRGVARALGVKATSAGSVRALKRRASSLGLDTSHFTHQRTWTDVALTDAVARSSSWSEVQRRLGLSGGDARIRLKGHAVRLGAEISHLEPQQPTPCEPELHAAKPEPSLLRAAAESFAAAWFAVRGFPVAIPSQPASYDLLVTSADGVQRIQVKTTTFRGKLGTWTVTIGQRPYQNERTIGRTSYDPDSLDYFFVIDGDYAVYLIPSAVVAGRLAINVGAYAPYRVGDASSLFAPPRDIGSDSTHQSDDAPPTPEDT